MSDIALPTCLLLCSRQTSSIVADHGHQTFCQVGFSCQEKEHELCTDQRSTLVASREAWLLARVTSLFREKRSPGTNAGTGNSCMDAARNRERCGPLVVCWFASTGARCVSLARPLPSVNRRHHRSPCATASAEARQTRPS